MSAKTQSRLKKKLREVRAELILDVAEEVLAEKGYHNTSVDEIAERAGVAKGTLYQHFSSKEELVFTLFERGMMMFRSVVEQAATSTVTPQGKLERILRYVYLEQQGTRSQLLRQLYHNEEIRTLLVEKKERLRERLEQLTDDLRAILEEGKAAGSFDQTIATEVMLASFLSVLSFKNWGHLIALERLAPEELVSQLARVFFAGIVVSAPD